jgi:hypothetical protein
VDAAVKVAGCMATVTNLGETKTFEAPRLIYHCAKISADVGRALLLRYWGLHGRPASHP